MLNLSKRSKYAKHRSLFVLAGIVVSCLLLAALAVLAVLAFGPIYVRVVEHPRFCGSLCHEMKPSYESYRKSSHNGIRCSECHSEPGVKGFARGLVVDAAREVYIHMSGEKFYNMDELHPRLSDSSCLRHECHKVEKLVADKILFADGNVFNHRAHLSRSSEMPGTSPALNCTSCHSQSKEKHTDVDRHVCFLCHFSSNGKTADISEKLECGSCHVIPASLHEKVQALENPRLLLSGERAPRDDTSCRKCHAVVASDTTVPEEKCAKCHEGEVKRMLQQDSESVHKAHVEPQNARCMECHQPLEQEHGQLIAHHSENCQSCHSQSKEMHALADAKAKRVCFLCHSVGDAQKCSDCHTKPVPQHETVMEDETSCAKCHTIVAAETSVPQEKCAKCHKGEVKVKLALDSDTVHKEHAELKANAPARCLECHLTLKQEHGQLFAHYASDCQKCHSVQESTCDNSLPLKG